MRRLILAAVLWPTLAAAQQPPQTVSMPTPLVGHVVQFLQSGGSYAEGTSLAQQVIEAVQEPQKEAARAKAEQEKIDAAVRAAASHPQVVEAPKPEKKQ